jgi:hypothetical protein
LIFAILSQRVVAVAWQKTTNPSKPIRRQNIPTSLKTGIFVSTIECR